MPDEQTELMREQLKVLKDLNALMWSAYITFIIMFIGLAAMLSGGS
jgi:Ni/Fe-hydrogenase subunit HybB-like protein